MILFLDFDGVLHPAEVFLRDGKPVFTSLWGHMFMWTPLLIEALEPYPDVKIILSTSWVDRMGFEYAKNQLPAELQQRVIGSTAPMMNGTRYQRIWRTIRREYDNTPHWLAIDDDTFEWGDQHRENLIACDPDLGIAEIVVFEKLKKALAELAQPAPSKGIKP